MSGLNLAPQRLHNMAPESFICSGCKKDLPRALFHEFASGCRKKPVTSKCRECRKEEYYSKRYSTVCICCMRHRPLNSNAQCKNCNTESVLRECKNACKFCRCSFCFITTRACVRAAKRNRLTPSLGVVLCLWFTVIAGREVCFVLNDDAE